MNRKSFLSKLAIGIPAIIASPQILASLKVKEPLSYQIKINGAEVVPFTFKLNGNWTIKVDNKASYNYGNF